MGEVVLVVDDEVDLRELWSEVLELSGHSVAAAGSVAEAGAVLRSGVLPRMALVDWSLPDGSGAEVVALLHERAPDCSIVRVTGGADPPYEGPGSPLAADLRKPFRLSELRRLLAVLLEPT